MTGSPEFAVRENKFPPSLDKPSLLENLSLHDGDIELFIHAIG